MAWLPAVHRRQGDCTARAQVIHWGLIVKVWVCSHFYDEGYFWLAFVLPKWWLPLPSPRIIYKSSSLIPKPNPSTSFPPFSAMICNTIHPIPGCGSGTELWQGTTALRRREETAISWRNCDDKRNDTFCFPMNGWMDGCFCSIVEPFAPPSSSSVCQSCG